MPWGEEYTGATLVDMYLAELAAHAWDLARATGHLARLDPSLAKPALDGARAMIKPQYRDMVEPGAPFGAEMPSPPGADDWERLAAFMGRDPRATLGRWGRGGRPPRSAGRSVGPQKRTPNPAGNRFASIRSMSGSLAENGRLPERAQLGRRRRYGRPKPAPRSVV